MKKTLITLATLAVLTTGSVMAQRGYTPYPAPVQARPYNDDAQDFYRIEQLDNMVNLSRHQKKEIKRIEDRYDRAGLTPGGRLYPQEAQRLQAQKQQEVMSVLNPAQRNVLYSFQQSRRPRQGAVYGRRY